MFDPAKQKMNVIVGYYGGTVTFFLIQKITRFRVDLLESFFELKIFNEIEMRKIIKTLEMQFILKLKIDLI